MHERVVAAPADADPPALAITYAQALLVGVLSGLAAGVAAASVLVWRAGL